MFMMMRSLMCVLMHLRMQFVDDAIFILRMQFVDDGRMQFVDAAYYW